MVIEAPVVSTNQASSETKSGTLEPAKSGSRKVPCASSNTGSGQPDNKRAKFETEVAKGGVVPLSKFPPINLAENDQEEDNDDTNDDDEDDDQHNKPPSRDDPPLDNTKAAAASAGTPAWLQAKKLYPNAKISIEAVRDYVKHCPMCQKTRDTGVTGLASRTLSLKPSTYRRTVGVNHVIVTPTDKHGNNCAIMVVEHFSHFPFVYAAKDYTAETVATVLFKHYCHHGTFDQLAQLSCPMSSSNSTPGCASTTKCP